METNFFFFYPQKKKQSTCFLLDSFMVEGYVTMVFSLLGCSLLDILEKCGPFPLSKLKTIGRNTLHAVKHLHYHDITHADIKPENILFRRNILNTLLLGV